jgi:hypothetical protein
MKLKIMSSIAMLSVAAMFVVRAQDAGNAEAERYIKESERQWAESVASGDSTVVDRIPDGSSYEKARMVNDTLSAPKYFLSNHLNEVKVRFYGDAAVAQGNESWVRRSGTPMHGRFVWTDTWIKRNGKWQIVAAEDLTVSEDK